MNYYVLNANDEIELFDTDKSRLQTTLKFKPDLADAKIHQTTKEIVELDGKFVFADEHESELLEKAKADKLAELTLISSRFDNQLINTDMIIKSSLGFSINADLRSQLNIHRLINIGTEPVSFVIADNTTADLSLAQLNILISECEENMQYLFGLKQSYKQQIEQAKTKEDLNAIKFEFTMKDFSKVSA